MLTQAWLAGDDSQSKRRDLVVTDAPQDKTVYVSLRAGLFALADSAAVAKPSGWRGTISCCVLNRPWAP